MKGVRLRPNAQQEADEESISGLPEWVKRQPMVRTVRWAGDVEDRVVARLQRGIRFTDVAGHSIPTGWPGITYKRTQHLPEGTVAAFDADGVLLGTAVV